MPYVEPPPANVLELALATLTTIVLEGFENVPVVLVQSAPEAVDVRVHVPVLVTVEEVPDMAKVVHVTPKVDVANVPIYTISVPAVESASASVYVEPGPYIFTGCENCLLLLVIVSEPRAARYKFRVPVIVIPLPSIKPPNIMLSTELKSAVPVNPENVMSAPSRGMSAVSVPVVFTFTTTLSCGSGTRLVHFEASDQLPPAEAVCVCVTGVSNVILELPKLSPMLVPVHVPAAPAAVMSWKST